MTLAASGLPLGWPATVTVLVVKTHLNNKLPYQSKGLHKVALTRGAILQQTLAPHWGICRERES